MTELLMEKIQSELHIKRIPLNISIPNIINIAMNMTDIGFSKLHVDTKDYNIVTLDDDYAVWETRDFTSILDYSYTLITDPAILGDYGMGSFDSGNMTYVIGSSAQVNDDGHLQIDLRQLDFMSTDFALKYDGIADIPDIMGRFISFSGNVLRGRLTSMVDYLGPEGWQNGINKLLSLVPDEMNIPWTNLILEGGFSKGIKVVKDSYARIPMDVSLQSKNKTLAVNNTADFSQVTNEGYQFCGCMSDYIMNSFIDPIYELGIFKYNASIKMVTTTWIDLALVTGGGLKNVSFHLSMFEIILTNYPFYFVQNIQKYGWDLDMPCESLVRVVDPAPEVQVSSKGAAFIMKVDVDVKCKKHANSTEFSQVFTLHSDPIKIISTVEINDDFHMIFNFAKFQIEFNNVTDSNVGEIKTKMLNMMSNGISTLLVDALDVIGKKGINL